MNPLPSTVSLLDCWEDAECQAQLVKLTRDLAATKIDGAWWEIEGISKTKRKEEDDHHWVWRKLVGQHQNHLAWEFVAVQTDDDEIQGAMVYRIDFTSLLDPGLTTLYVDRLATAPRNRPWLVATPHYRGTGLRLLLWAVRHSYTLGLGGRVSLVSLPAERTRDFYARRGFTAIGRDDDDLVQYELGNEAAQNWLREEGCLQ